jgi:CBS domain-containing protein
VTETLVRVGYTRCNGGVMASEPEWRREAAQWRRRWTTFFRDASPEHLLNSQITFDSRTVAGDPSLGEPFLELRRRAPESAPFMAHLAKRAMDFRPPLGFMGRLQVARGGDHPGTFDIKAGAVLPIVQFARIHGLMVQASVVDTIGRLDAAEAAGEVSADLASMLREGYELAMRIRMEHQVEQWRHGVELDNRIDPGMLSSWRRMALREAFKAIKSAQEALSLNFQSGLVR